MTDQEKIDIRNLIINSMKEAKIHTEPSPLTLIALEKLKDADQKQDIVLTEMRKDICNVTDSNTKDHNEIMLFLKEIRQEMITGFARKWVEKTLILVGTIIVTALVYALLSLILKQP